MARLEVALDLGLSYLTLERTTPTLSPGELQRLRLATQVRSNLFGVVYVLDEPSAGLHPADTEALLRALDRLKKSGNSLFVVEHEIDVMRCADWIVDVGPDAGSHGGRILYSGPPEGLRNVAESRTRPYLFPNPSLTPNPNPSLPAPPTQSKTATELRAAPRRVRAPSSFLSLSGITRNNLRDLRVELPLGVLTSVTGVSGSGKSTLISQALVSLLFNALGQAEPAPNQEDPEDGDPLEKSDKTVIEGQITRGLEHVKRLVLVDQKPIGRTPRSNLATYTGLFDHVRKIFAATKMAVARKYDAGRFSFNVKKGRCEVCGGEGSVMVELLFLPSVYAPCSACQGARYNEKTLEVKLRGQSIADVLQMTVDAAWSFFEDDANVHRALGVLREVGLGYLRLGQPATELSGGEAQRIKLATELQRVHRADTLYVLDEPTTGLHPADVDRLVWQLQRLVDSGATVIVVEHDMRVIAQSDWVIDMGPGAGDEGGRIVVAGPPSEVVRSKKSRTSPFLRRFEA